MAGPHRHAKLEEIEKSDIHQAMADQLDEQNAEGQSVERQNSELGLPLSGEEAWPSLQLEAGDSKERWMEAKSSALELCKSGNHLEAEQMYRQLIAQGFNDASVCCNLGNLCRLSGRHEEGLALLHQSVEIDPGYANGFYNLGVAYQQEGNNPKEAIRYYRKALACNPQFQLAHRHQGVAFRTLGRAVGAFFCFKRYLELNENEPELLLDVARLCRKLSNQIFTIYQTRLDHNPTDSHTALCLGIALREARLLEQAAFSNAFYLSASPNSVSLWIEQAFCLMELGEATQALAACEQALKLEPENPGAHFTKGNCLRSTGHLVEAEECMQHAVDLQPDFADAIVNLAIHKRDQGFLEEAISQFQEAIRLQPKHPEAWEGLLFSYSIGGAQYRELMLKTSVACWKALDQNIVSSQKVQSPKTGISQPLESIDRKVRIGIVSAEIGHHVVSTFLDSFLSYYDRNKIHAELIVPHLRKDPGASSLIQKANCLINLHDKDIATARETLRSRSYDIIIETSGNTEHNSLKVLSERCAPIQCHYIGYHATTGLSTIDYIIVDHELLPESLDPYFTETPWRLNRPWLACKPYADPPLAFSTAESPAPVWGSFGQVAKIREETLGYWASALRAVPEATLVIKDRNTVFEAARRRILESLECHGVASNRVSFLPWTKTWHEHMLCHNQIDVALDTTPWSSSTTAFNALSMGVPLVAIRGQTMAARMSASIVAGLGKPEWICDTEEAFASTLVELSRKVPELRAGKQSLQAEVLASQLFDGKHLTQHLESAFRQMIANHQS